MSYNDIRTTEPPFPTPVSQDDYDALAARLAEAVAAVQAFADHFGPLEDNHMLNDECRHCFALARGVLGTADSADEVQT